MFLNIFKYYNIILSREKCISYSIDKLSNIIVELKRIQENLHSKDQSYHLTA